MPHIGNWRGNKQLNRNRVHLVDMWYATRGLQGFRARVPRFLNYGGLPIIESIECKYYESQAIVQFSTSSSTC